MRLRLCPYSFDDIAYDVREVSARLSEACAKGYAVCGAAVLDEQLIVSLKPSKEVNTYILAHEKSMTPDEVIARIAQRDIGEYDLVVFFKIRNSNYALWRKEGVVQ